MTRVALQLVDELLDARRITSVEAGALRDDLAAVQAAADADHWLVPRAFDPEAMRTWVRRVCAEMALNPTGLEREAGLGPSTLTKFLVRTDDANLGASTINAIVLACRDRLACPTQSRRPVRTVDPRLPAFSADSTPAAIASLDDLYDRFHGVARVGRAIGKTTEHAGAMRRRGSIPIEYWPALIAAARDIGLHLDEALLVRIHLTASAEERSAP